LRQNVRKRGKRVIVTLTSINGCITNKNLHTSKYVVLLRKSEGKGDKNGKLTKQTYLALSILSECWTWPP